MKSFFNSYHTCYNYSLQGGELQKLNTICFASLFHQLDEYYLDSPTTPISLTIDVFLFKYHLNHELNNCVILSDTELHWYFNYLKRLHKFKYSLINENDKYTLSITCKLPPMHIKHLMNCIRYTYEFPYSGLFADSLQIMKIKSISKNLNLLEIFYAIMNFCDHGNGHMPRPDYDALYIINYKKLKCELNNKPILSASFNHNTSIIKQKYLENDKSFTLSAGKYYWDTFKFKQRFILYKPVLAKLIRYKKTENVKLKE